MGDISLLELQRLFKEDVAKGTRALEIHLKESQDRSLGRRIGIYRNNSQLTVESVIEDFPLLSDFIGEERLHRFVERFLQDRPSTTSSRAYVSRGFPAYLKDQNEILLSEIARYDWAQVLASSEPEIKNDFRPIAELDSDDVQLIVDPTLQLLHSTFAVHRDNEETETFLGIRYRNSEIEIDELTKPQFLLLQSIVEQTELPELELSDQEISQAFAQWVANGTIIGFRNKESYE